MRRLRGDLVLQVHMRRGPLWDAVREVRGRWNITAKVQLPSPVLGRLVPEDAPEADDHQRYSDYAARWRDEMSAIRAKVDPEIGLPTWDYSDYQLQASWSDFLAACVLYDPPDDQLVEFAAYGGLEPTFLDGGRILRKDTIKQRPKMADPPVRSLWALTELRDWYWRRILEYVGERYLEPQGVDLEYLLEDPVTHVPGLYEEYREKYERYSKRYYIEVDEYTSSEDVRNAFSTIIRSMQYPERLKPERDRLTAVQCAVLHDRHNQPDPEDKRRRPWSYAKLGERFGMSARAAKDHVILGRKIIEEQDADKN